MIVIHLVLLVQDALTPQANVHAMQDTWVTNVMNVPQIIMNLLKKSVQVRILLIHILSSFLN